VEEVENWGKVKRKGNEGKRKTKAGKGRFERKEKK